MSSVHICRMWKRSWLRLFFIVFFVLCCIIIECVAVSKFTNMQCLSMDPDFSQFEECRMRAVKRDVNEISLRLKLLPPAKTIHNLTMRWQLMKKASGYKPFLYDITLDMCEYLDKRNHPFINIIFATFSNHTNGFNRCPLKDDIVLENFGFPNKALSALPLPSGEYALFSTFGSNGNDLVAIKVYFIITEF